MVGVAVDLGAASGACEISGTATGTLGAMLVDRAGVMELLIREDFGVESAPIKS